MSGEDVDLAALCGSVDRMVDRILARPENAPIAEEWRECERAQQEVLDALQRCVTESDLHRAMAAASFVVKELPQLVYRRFAARRVLARLLTIEPPGPFVMTKKA